MAIETIPHLRPLGIGQLLDRAIRLYRQNFLRFVGIIAVVQIPVMLAQGVFAVIASVSQARIQQLQQQMQQDPSALPRLDNPFALFGPEYFIGMGGTCVTAIIAFVLVQGVATAALSRAVADSYLGLPIGVMDAYRRIGRSWLRLVGALVLAILIGILLFVWLLVPCIGWATGVGMLTFWGWAIVPLIAPVVVLEKQSVTGCIRRVWDLARRRFWWTIGFVSILYLFAVIVTGGPSTLISLVFQYLIRTATRSGDILNLTIAQSVAQSLVTLVFGLIYTPLQLTAITLLYFDLRVRTEGFDLALQAEGLSGGRMDIESIVAQSPPPEVGHLLTWLEMGYFMLLSVAAVAVWALFVGISMVLSAIVLGASGGIPGVP